MVSNPNQMVAENIGRKSELKEENPTNFKLEYSTLYLKVLFPINAAQCISKGTLWAGLVIEKRTTITPILFEPIEIKTLTIS